MIEKRLVKFFESSEMIESFTGSSERFGGHILVRLCGPCLTVEQIIKCIFELSCQNVGETSFIFDLGLLCVVEFTLIECNIEAEKEISELFAR